MYTLGIDIGSAATKAVLLYDGKDTAAQSVIAAGTGTTGPDRAVAEILAISGLHPSDIARTVATGYGRIIYKGADQQISEITCHARGVSFQVPGARTVIDIGGQDIKVIRLNRTGAVVNFVMNDKCAAGTGRFLEVMARVLGIDIAEMAVMSERSSRPVSISSTCTIFAESEVISQLSNGETVPDIAAGIHRSVAKRVAGLASRLGLESEVVMTGGVAKNQGVVRALAEELKQGIAIAPDSQMTGALGAALTAWDFVMPIIFSGAAGSIYAV